ncbi:MAG: gliding motility-associated C-terminal domain-containing protein [Bacteroidetes bacterium]|nr:gliding motility-associated C-terminal domain-containing protein [Bacteroidota bacterium]
MKIIILILPDYLIQTIMRYQQKVITHQNRFVTTWCFLLILLLLLISLQTYSQREADRWYFGKECGLNFNSGVPEVLHDGKAYEEFGGVGTMSDSLGNLLFYAEGDTIHTSQHTVMENGLDFVQFGTGSQSNLIIPWPESDSLYFVFMLTVNSGTNGLYYNIVDMSRNNGLGAVIEKDIELPFAWDALDQLTATRHENKRDIWVITRKYRDDNYAVFLVTPDGINETPSLYPAPDRMEQDADYSWMKVSYDKKYLFSTSSWADITEICKFNNETGEIEFLYEHNMGEPTFGVEFSPDSKFAYISYNPPGPLSFAIRQHDMQYVENPSLFITTSVIIGEENGRVLQLATDGKIYCMENYDSIGSSPEYFVGVIHEPWKKGTDCLYERYAVNMFPGEPSAQTPSIFMDYLYRFEFEGICESELFQFTSNFNPVPDSIRWNFDDFLSGINNVSNELNPTHSFSDGGIFEVQVDVWYPSGRFEHTSREVEVIYSPEPDLGSDTTICDGQEVILNAECGPHNYLWSTGQIGSNHITVADSGWYWVKVTNNVGCFTIDSIYVGYHQPAIADITNLEVSPTTCGGSTGVIRGLDITGNPPLTYQWVDDLGNPIGTSIDIYNLIVGNYTLQVVDSNNCTTEIGPFNIFDAGDLLIQQIDYAHEHCDQQDGSIIISAINGLGSMLFYSIDNGATYSSNLGVFTGLSSGSYVVRVKDSSDCQSVYINNPVIIQNINSPEIIDIQIGASSVGQNNGSIIITASGGSDTLYYSHDNGLNFQINDGGFFNLTAGYYTCVVKDEIGCDTTFVVEVPQEVTIRLQAVAGDDEVCPGNSAFVPLVVSNFNDVGNFKTTLLYNEDLIVCQGFANANPQLEDSLEVMLFPAEGKVELYWASTAVTLPDNTTIADLVFQANDQGISFVEWDGSPGAGFFHNSTGLTIPVDYFLGTVKIYSELDVSVYGSSEICQAETLNLEAHVWFGNGGTTYLWTEPNGDTSSNMNLIIHNMQPSHAGTYSVIATDTVDCYSEVSVDVIIYPTLFPDFAVQDSIFMDDPFDLDAGTGFSHYLWNTGDTTQTLWINNDGWYSAKVESVDGCIGEDSSYVVFSSPPELIKMYFPNAFTPNGDGLNDEFKPVTNTIDIAPFTLLIYNRWGALIYQTNDISQGWDGKLDGELCLPGAYVYKIAYSSSFPSTTSSEIKMGTVMLVR